MPKKYKMLIYVITDKKILLSLPVAAEIKYRLSARILDITVVVQIKSTPLIKIEIILDVSK